jgi:diacylglycerol kinase family enzyme
MATSPFGNLAVIADPRAGGGVAAGVLDRARRAIADRGIDHEVFVADGDGAATALAATAMDGGFRYLAALGDDRTVQDVVNGMFRDGRPIVEEAVLAVLPAADCDLIRSFGLPTDVDGASHHLLGDATYALDVMKVAATGPDGERRIRYGHNLGEVGFHAAATMRSGARPAGEGRGRRFLAFWRAYVRSGVRAVRLDVDAKTHTLRAWSVVIGNGQFADGGLRLSPRSFPGDGVLDALVFVGPRSDAYRMLPRLFRHGDHIPDPGITELRARIRVAVDADRPMPVVLDGVSLGTTPVTFQVLPQPIRLKL